MEYQRCVRTSDDIESLYRYVLNHPEISVYRAYTSGHENSGDSFYWDPQQRTYSHVGGVEYFPNPNYAPPENEITFSLDELYGS